MTMPSQDQAAKLRATLLAARAGRATLPELAVAYELASGTGLHGCATELRGHIQDKLGPAPPRASAGRDVLLGVASGALTHYVLRSS